MVCFLSLLFSLSLIEPSPWPNFLQELTTWVSNDNPAIRESSLVVLSNVVTRNARYFDKHHSALATIFAKALQDESLPAVQNLAINSIADILGEDVKDQQHVDFYKPFGKPIVALLSKRLKAGRYEDVSDMLNKMADLADVAPKNKAEIAEKFPGRFFFTPKKAGAQTAEANANAGFAAANQICAYFESGCTKFQVNK